MKFLAALALMLAVSTATAQYQKTPYDLFLEELQLMSIQYMSISDDNTIRLFVFESTDPDAVCEIGSKFDLPSLTVTNYTNEKRMVCGATAQDAI